MRAAPFPNDDQTQSREDAMVADPLSDWTINLWNETARKNRAVFSELFRPVPTNLVRTWAEYDVCDILLFLNCSLNENIFLELSTQSEDRTSCTWYFIGTR